MLQDNIQLSRKSKPTRLSSFVYYTDGGVDNDSYNYFIDKLFAEDSMYCYASRAVDPEKGGVHLQAYLGRSAINGQLQPITYRKDPNNPMIIEMNIDKFVVDQKEIESFKQLTTLTIDKRSKNYTCFCKAFALFVSEKEINIEKS